MEDALHPAQDAPAEPIPEVTVATSVMASLRTLNSTNEAAALLLLQRADTGALGIHMTDGEIRALADELLQTCQEADDED